MKELKFRNLRPDEIEVKPCTIAKDKSWVQILLYKTSRVDMQVLTEMYGQRWKSEYNMVGDSLFCTISVYDEELGEWISRTDCGEKDAGISEDKSWATSAFKRAATQFGIGIELYNTPRIKLTANEKWFWDNRLTMTFSVKEIEWDGDKCTKLVILDKFGNVVYNYDQYPSMQVPKELKDKVAAAEDTDALKSVFDENKNWHTNKEFQAMVRRKKDIVG